MVDLVVGILLDKLLKVLESEWHRQLALGEQFNKMNDDLLFMRSYLKDVERVRRKDQTETLKTTTKNLMELVYDAEDAIADCQIQFAKQHRGRLLNYMRNWSPKLLKFRHEMTKRLMVINQGIEEVKKSMDSYLSTAPMSTRRKEDDTRPLSYPILMNEEKILGLEEGVDTIKRWVLETDELFTVIGIVGMGGIGKTTLAENIRNSEKVKHSFKSIAFVSVSQSFKFEDLLIKMLNQMDDSKSSSSAREVRELLDTLKRKLEDKKYLLVLDDVWETAEGMWWDSLNSVLPKRNGGCVIVTTRKLEVAASMGADQNHIHEVKTLSHDDSWSLFTKIAFARTDGKCCNPDLEHFGKKIVARCEGLPLAITAVAGMMLAKGDSVYEWRRISKHLKDEMAEHKKGKLVMSSLELSYEELPSHLKPCFLCFAMYPEDYHIYIDEIISRWIGEGLVSARNGRTAFETGEEYIAELMGRCLLIGSRTDDFNRRFVFCRMHDMVRDMVIQIARDENFTSFDEKERPIFNMQHRRVGISMNSAIESSGSKVVKNSITCSKLRTLFALYIEKDVILNLKMKIFDLKWLRVLYLLLSEKMTNEEILGKDCLDGIGSLRHLVYLYIGCCALEKLPDSVGDLSNLQLLSLDEWPKLKMLPPSIIKLGKLISFQILDCHSLECLPDGVQNLLNLERLEEFCPASSVHRNAFQIGQLKSLGQLRLLHIVLESPNQLEEGELKVLSELQNLRVLLIEIRNNNNDDDESSALMSKLNHQFSPLQDLEELQLIQFPGESTPIWLNPMTFPSLRFLRIFGGELTHMGPGFWERENAVWKIEVLVLDHLSELEEDSSKFYEAMPSLRKLKASHCSKLIESFPSDVSEHDQVQTKKAEDTSDVSQV